MWKNAGLFVHARFFRCCTCYVVVHIPKCGLRGWVHEFLRVASSHHAHKGSPPCAGRIRLLAVVQGAFILWDTPCRVVECLNQQFEALVRLHAFSPIYLLPLLGIGV